jgi:hypothetical protein
MPPFNPAEKLIKLQGKDYLQVRDRLLWLREAQPDAVVETEIVAFDIEKEWAIVRATVTLSTGARATGMAFQRPTGIAKDFVANGETSAIGRALGALGFGTQFAIEFDQPDGQVVDSPIAPRPAPAAASTAGPASEAQRAWYFKMMAKQSIAEGKAADILADVSNGPVDKATPDQLRSVIEAAENNALMYGEHSATGRIGWYITRSVVATETPAVR